MTSTTSTTPDALSRDGHPVKIVRTSFEDGVEFAWIKYLDGHCPGPVGGRIAGTEDDPIWEHRVEDGKVLKSGGDYYRDEDWTIERGLQPVTPSDRIRHAREAAADAFAEVANVSKAAELELRGRLVPTGEPGQRRDPETGCVYYSSAWLQDRVEGHLVAVADGEVIGMIEPRSAIEALRLEPLAAFLDRSRRCDACGEPVADDAQGVEVIWSGVPHDAMLCAYYRDLKAIPADEAEAELAAAARRARIAAGWSE